MRSMIQSCLAAAVGMTLVAPSWAEPRTFDIDPGHFAVSFAVDHLGYASVLGFFRDAEGTFVYDEATGEFESGRVVVQADSVFTDNKKRDEHLRSDDFLDAKGHPEIVFELTGFEASGDRRGVLSGNLTLRGETHPVDVQVTLNKTGDYPFGHGDYTMGLSATTTIQRSTWGMDYGQDMVGDEVHLRFELEANEDSGLF
ncbi:YceI family protein [Marinobacter sp. JSM 1782161]|uniref:YceI family protein n=1 Tax=Marinobacter sp. JSM 1782161 TaxID=2685906 RepID=UPI0014040F04|nr:YceI family protein [Marinobacter sp. JSM 1782161]